MTFFVLLCIHSKYQIYFCTSFIPYQKNEQKLKWNLNYPSKLLVSFISSLTSMSIRSYKWKKIENSCPYTAHTA